MTNNSPKAGDVRTAARVELLENTLNDCMSRLKGDAHSTRVGNLQKRVSGYS